MSEELKIKFLVIICIFMTCLISEDLNISEDEGSDFFKAIQLNDLEKIDLYLRNFEDLNFVDKNGDNILFFAIRKNDIRLVNKIIDKGININHKNFKLSTALHLACKVNSYKIVESLLKKNISIDVMDISGNKAIYYAKQHYNSRAITLIKYYKDVEKNNKQVDESNRLDSFIKNFNKNPIDEI